MQTFGRTLACIGALTLVAIAVFAVVVATGVYSAGASSPHSKAVSALLDTAMERSVRWHARSVTVPPGIDVHDVKLAQSAVSAYNEMCRDCHGAPGRKAEHWTVGLYPSAPDLTDASQERQWRDEEVYWIIKNGIKDTGMSSFGATHDEHELWALTALVRRFLTMSPEQYRAWTQTAPHDSDEKPATAETK